MRPKLRALIIALIKVELKSRAKKLKFKRDTKLYELFMASECLLIESYDHSVAARLGDNASGVTCSTEGGSFEFGMILYLLNNPPKFLAEAAWVLSEILELMAGGVPLPKSKITPALYKKILKQILGDGVVAKDGTIYGDGKYEQLDPGWFFSLLYFVYYQIRPDRIHRFNTQPTAKPIRLQGSKPGQVSIAILGDWGTGEYTGDGGPAVAVMDAISSLDTDYVVHLGDVYYAGTQGIVRRIGEEDDNLMDLWPKERFQGGKKKGTSFTLNSNHEMYDGANGYFKVALSQRRTPFNKQKKASFFAMEFKPWTIVGFDSAYFSSPKNLFMDGSLGGKNGVQAKWCRQNFGDKKGKNVVVLTHHNGLATDGGKREDALWNDVIHAVNGVPDYWYWGHVHLGIVYGDDLPAAAGAKMRCTGNAAIPNAEPWGLERTQHIDYYPKTKVGKGLRVRNGFAMITLHAKTATAEARLEETFYEVEDGTSTPVAVWSSPVATV